MKISNVGPKDSWDGFGEADDDDGNDIDSWDGFGGDGNNGDNTEEW